MRNELQQLAQSTCVCVGVVKLKNLNNLDDAIILGSMLFKVLLSTKQYSPNEKVMWVRMKK
jgi:hypothetical protein